MPLFGRRKTPEDLLGRWYGRVEGEVVAAEFRGDGKLAWVIVADDGSRKTMILTYRVDGEDLITNQPSQPREERTKYELNATGLTLEFGGVKTHLVR